MQRRPVSTRSQWQSEPAEPGVQLGAEFQVRAGLGTGMVALEGTKGTGHPLAPVAAAAPQVRSLEPASPSWPAVAVVAAAALVLLLPGHMNAGKSTLTAALIQAGCDYLGDESIGIRHNTLAAVAYPKPLSLDATSREFLGLHHTDFPTPRRPNSVPMSPFSPAMSAGSTRSSYRSTASRVSGPQPPRSTGGHQGAAGEHAEPRPQRWIWARHPVPARRTGPRHPCCPQRLVLPRQRPAQWRCPFA